MRQINRWLGTLCTIALLGALLSACGTKNEVPEGSEAVESSSATRVYTDLLDRKVEIPAQPQKIVYYDGKTFGDILALGVKPIGADGRYFKESMTVYPERFAGIEDIGFPINLEKLINLKPDLIIMGVLGQGNEIEQLSKIAPAIVIDPDAPLEERLHTLGELTGKTAEAEKWLASYQDKAEQTWQKLGKSANIGADETASVFMYAYEKKFYVMGRGLTATLYQPSGFKPQEAVQKALLDNKEPFLEISYELLPDYTGDRVFLIVSEETSNAANELMNSTFWKNVAAVKNGLVYQVEARLSLPDAITRDKLLDELPGIMAKQ